MCRCQFWVPTGASYSEDIGDSEKATKPEDIALSTLKLFGLRNQSLCATSAWPLHSRETVLHVIQPLILPTIHLKRTIMKGILAPPHLNFCEPYGRVWWLPRLQQAQEAPQPTPYASSHPEQFPSYLFNHLYSLRLHSNTCMQIYIPIYN